MTKLTLGISKIADGSMYNRQDITNQTVIENRKKYLDSLAISMDQTTRINPNMLIRDKTEHDTDFCRYKEVGIPEKGAGMTDDTFIADALVTRDIDHALFLPVADCVGAIFYDPTKHILMLSHLGRQSVEQNGAVRSVEYLKQKYEVEPKDLLVWLTPAPSQETYPIWALDNKSMKQVTFEQLKTAGILADHITDNPAETDKDSDYFSYSEFLQGRRSIDGDHAIVAMMIN